MHRGVTCPWNLIQQLNRKDPQSLTWPGTLHFVVLFACFMLLGLHPRRAIVFLANFIGREVTFMPHKWSSFFQQILGNTIFSIGWALHYPFRHLGIKPEAPNAKWFWPSTCYPPDYPYLNYFHKKYKGRRFLGLSEYVLFLQPSPLGPCLSSEPLIGSFPLPPKVFTLMLPLVHCSLFHVKEQIWSFPLHSLEIPI